LKKKYISLAASLVLCSTTYATDNIPEESFPTDDFPDEVLEDELAMEEMFLDEEILISATGYSKPARYAPSVATVITAHEMEGIGARTIFEALESVPGLHISKRPILDAPLISIRGIHTAQNPEILILRNGLPIKYPTEGNFSRAFRAPIANIARLEIIRGPGSAVHGADAFSGVINIVTKDANEIDGTTFGARVGSFDTQDVWALHGDKYGDWDTVFSLELSHSNGDRDRKVDSDLQSTFDGMFGTTASLAPGPIEDQHEYLETSLYVSNESWDIELWHWRQNDGGLGPGGAQALDPEGTEDYKYYQLDIGHTNKDLHPDLELKTRFNYVYQDVQRKFILFPSNTTVIIGADGNIFTAGGGPVNFPDGILGNPGFDDHTYTVDLTALYKGMDNHFWRTSIGYSRQEVETNEEKNFGPGVTIGTLTDVTGTENIYMKDQDRERWYAAIQDEWKFAKGWELTAGIRYDHYSDFGKTINPRAALVWSPPLPLTTKLLYGRAFRAPALNELYYINNPAALGDSGLDPETIDTMELAFEYYPFLELDTRLSLFYYDMDDTINMVATPAGTIATNTEGQRGYGFELEAEWDVTEKIELRSNFSWQHSENKDNHSRVADAPGRQFHFSAGWNFAPYWNITSQVNWVGARRRNTTDTRDEIDDYTFVDLTLRKRTASRTWEMAVSARNLFDKKADEPSNGSIPGDYPLPERSLYAEIKYHYR